MSRQNVGVPSLNGIPATPVVSLSPPLSSHLYRLNPDHTLPAPRQGRYVAPGAVLCDSRSVDFRARTLLIGTAQAVPNLDEPVNSALVSGAMTFELEGSTEGGEYVRVFQIGVGDSKRIDVTAFSTVRVRVKSSTLMNTGAYAILTSQESDADKFAFLAVEHLTQGTYIVPPGAETLYVSTPDATFAWATPIDNTRQVTVTQAVVAGQAVPVAGLYYRPTAEPFRGVFKVLL